MSKRTIHELIAGLGDLSIRLYGDDRLLLLEVMESLREFGLLAKDYPVALEAVRAFVERVNARWLQNVHVKNYDFRFYVCEELEAMQMEELAAMEAEVKE